MPSTKGFRTSKNKTIDDRTLQSNPRRPKFVASSRLDLPHGILVQCVKGSKYEPMLRCPRDSWLLRSLKAGFDAMVWMACVDFAIAASGSVDCYRQGEETYRF